MAGALGLAHYVRPLARETLGLSAGLKGNGMCFSNRLSKMVKWRPGALTEDIELGFDLVELYRIRVRFVKDAIVRAQMPTSGKQSESQRLRWEKGRSFIRRHRAWPLFLKGLVRLDFTAVDCALDVIVPPLAELALLIMFGAALIGIVKFIGAPIFGLSAELVFCAFGFILYVLGGMMLSDVPREAFYALFIGPFYAFWKLFMILFRSKGRPKTWKKTKRKAIELQQSSKNAAKNDLDKL
jgi:cellulose synthase/poly-beta-1,6-N-acetylglucosamine synthase-like glycosyltransferase